QFQRGLPAISPTMLTKRLGEMVEDGLIFKKQTPGQKGYDYFLTPAGKELMPVVTELGVWGMKWARGQLADVDFDVELLMTYLGRSIKPEMLGATETIVRFHFTDLKRLKKWWIIVTGNDVDVCIKDPGKEIDVWFETDLKTMVSIWMGDCSYKSAVREKKCGIYGSSTLTRNVSSWMSNSVFAGIPPAAHISD
ncbi:MAG: helix-turn-helix transcriptional regulator, partial [Deltaproteobacteria bacterium]|nr:helix-turn-helix transcriptional regulator [Deltaproteobacteria bacterium]